MLSFVTTCLSVCLSVRYLSFTPYWNVIESATLSIGTALSVALPPSVCPSILLVPRLSRNRKAIETSKLVETSPWTRVTKAANLRSKGQRSRPLGNENVKSFFRACRPYFRQKWIDLFQTKTKIIRGRPLDTISSNTFHQRKCYVFLIICDHSSRRDACYSRPVDVHLLVHGYDTIRYDSRV